MTITFILVTLFLFTFVQGTLIPGPTGVKRSALVTPLTPLEVSLKLPSKNEHLTIIPKLKAYIKALCHDRCTNPNCGGIEYEGDCPFTVVVGDVDSCVNHCQSDHLGLTWPVTLKETFARRAHGVSLL
jgi:hypothetical protein